MNRRLVASMLRRLAQRLDPRVDPAVRVEAEQVSHAQRISAEWDLRKAFSLREYSPFYDMGQA